MLRRLRTEVKIKNTVTLISRSFLYWMVPTHWLRLALFPVLSETTVTLCAWVGSERVSFFLPSDSEKLLLLLVVEMAIRRRTVTFGRFPRTSDLYFGGARAPCSTAN